MQDPERIAHRRVLQAYREPEEPRSYFTPLSCKSKESERSRPSDTSMMNDAIAASIDLRARALAKQTVAIAPGVTMFTGAKHQRALDSMERSIAAPKIRCSILDEAEQYEGYCDTLLPPPTGSSSRRC